MPSYYRRHDIGGIDDSHSESHEKVLKKRYIYEVQTLLGFIAIHSIKHCGYNASFMPWAYFITQKSLTKNKYCSILIS